MRVLRVLPYCVTLKRGDDNGWCLDIRNRDYKLIALAKLRRKLTDPQLQALAFNGEVRDERDGQRSIWLYDGSCTPDTAANWNRYAERLYRMARIQTHSHPPGVRDPDW